MTRWLQAAQRASEGGNKLNLPKQPPAPEVNSVNSVNSGGQKADASPSDMTPDALALDLYEERAAIREFDGGQDRETAERAAWAEARRAAGITALDDWRCPCLAGVQSGKVRPVPPANLAPGEGYIAVSQIFSGTAGDSLIFTPSDLKGKTG